MRYIIFFLLMTGSVCGYGQELSSILKNPSTYDGKSVTVTGEVIGEVLYAPGGVWLNILTERGINIGIFCAQKNQVQEVTRYGSYTHRGDRIRVEGVFYSDCPQHSERDIHAHTISVVEPGGIRTDAVSRQKKTLAIILTGICGMLTVMYLVKTGYGRKNQKH